MHNMPVVDDATGSMVRGRGIADALADLKGTVNYELYRGGKLLQARSVPNGITNGAKNALLDAWFNGGSSSGSIWYIGLVDESTYTSFATTDTMDSHSGWTELTSYTVGGNGLLRGTWGQGSASGQAVTNGTAVEFDFTATGIVQGIFAVSDGTKSGNIGTLWSTASFNAPLNVESGDQLRVTYTVQL